MKSEEDASASAGPGAPSASGRFPETDLLRLLRDFRRLHLVLNVVVEAAFGMNFEAQIVHNINQVYHVPSPPKYVHVPVPGPTIVKPAPGPGQPRRRQTGNEMLQWLSRSQGHDQPGRAIPCETARQGAVGIGHQLTQG